MSYISGIDPASLNIKVHHNVSNIGVKEELVRTSTETNSPDRSHGATKPPPKASQRKCPASDKPPLKSIKSNYPAGSDPVTEVSVTIGINKKARRACSACRRAHVTCGRLPYIRLESIH